MAMKLGTMDDLLRELALYNGVSWQRFKDMFIDELQDLPPSELLYVLRTTRGGHWDDLTEELVTECLMQAAKRAVQSKLQHLN